MIRAGVSLALAMTALASCMSGPTENDAVLSAANGPELAGHEVKIFRDEWGVPHIYALAEEDGYFGLAYAMMADQPERFLAGILATRGELAANVVPEDLPPQVAGLFGGAAQMVESDYQAKLWRLAELAADASPRLAPQLQENYRLFLKGVRAYFETYPEQMPAWAPKDISVADLVAYSHFALWSSYQAGIGMLDCQRGGGAFISAHGAAEALERGYSNEWAVMPRKTATGGAILLSDPHGGIDGRFVYEFRLHAGDLDLAGYTFGAMSLVGRNADVGWGVTTGSPDIADCYRIETVPGDAAHYLYDGALTPIDTRTITIGVKGSEPLVIKARYTQHNGLMSPVVAESPGTLFVVSTPYVGSMEGMHNAYYRIYKSRTVDEFRDALNEQGMFPQHLLAADTQGDILFVNSGLTPVRPEGDIDWTLPVDGNTSATAWQGFHPVDDLVVIKSPPAGFLQNNNVDTRLMDKVPPVETIGKPDYLLTEGWLPSGKQTTRSVRAINVLSDIQGMTEAQAFGFAFDAKTELSDRWLALLAESLPMEGAAKVAPFLGDLMTFDGQMTAGSTGALKYVYWRESLREMFTEEDIPVLEQAFNADIPLPDDLKVKFAAAVSAAQARLEAAPGGLQRTYGDEFRQAGEKGESWARSGGSLESYPGPPKECGVVTLMCDTTMFPASFTPPDELARRYAYSGSRMMRLDFYSPEGIRSYTAFNPGISDDPESVHADDQAERLMATSQMKEVYFEWERLSPNIVSEMDLVAREDLEGAQ